MSRSVTIGGNIVWIAFWAALCYYGSMPWITWLLVAPWCMHGILLAIPPEEVPPVEDWDFEPPVNTGFIARRNMPWERDLWDDE